MNLSNLKSTFLLGLCASTASATVVFHTDFDEATLAATGLTIDTPNTNLATPDSGTVTLDTVNQTLDLASNGSNLWTNREGAPIASVAAPVVALGVTWYVETTITHTDSPGGTASGYDQAGITFYSGNLGSNPGNENPGNESLFAGIDDWNAWRHRVQGFADNNPSASVNAPTGDDTFEYRVEITEGGASDTYNFFYKNNPTDAWTQYGPTDLAQNFNNTNVGLFMKANNVNTTATTEFDRFTIGVVIPEPSTGLLAGLGTLSLLMRRRRK